jgi:hypothetical protein
MRLEILAWIVAQKTQPKHTSKCRKHGLNKKCVSSTKRSREFDISSVPLSHKFYLLYGHWI